MKRDRSGGASRTCVLLRQHGPVHHPLKHAHPVPLVLLRLAGKQELPVRGHYGDAEPPVVALGGGREAGQHGVAVLFAPYKHLAPGVGILGRREGPIRNQERRNEVA